MKKCTSCKEEKLLQYFYFKKLIKRYESKCKKCHNTISNQYYKIHKNSIRIYQKKYRKQNFEKIKVEKRKWHLKKYYKLTIEEYEFMKQQQDNKCLCCGEVKEKLVVDHNHVTEKVRSLICNKCNVLVGYLEKDNKAIKKAQNYINIFQKEEKFGYINA